MAQKNLFGPNGKERISYLTNDRGLRIDTIQMHRLGWLPAKNHIPSKIIIPCYNPQGKLIRIRCRIDDPKSSKERYRIIKGGDPHAPFPLGIKKGKPLIILESELDAILIAQEAVNISGVLSLGSTGVKLSSKVVKYLNEYFPIILISLDNDKSGEIKSKQINKDLLKSIVWTIPIKFGKDPGEAWKHINIGQWVEQGIRNSKSK